jgi:Ca2+-binding RTX toxin-like protein
LNGGAGNDSLIGGTGADNPSGGADNDTLSGGAGNDVINAGSGSDVVNYTIGDGADAVIGGTSPGVGAANSDIDTLNVIGTVGNDSLNVVFNGAMLTRVGSGTIAEIERVDANLLDGSDTLNYGNATSVAVSVNFLAHNASGFASIAGIENVTADTLTGDGLANTLTGDAGNDNAGNDTLSGRPRRRAHRRHGYGHLCR